MNELIRALDQKALEEAGRLRTSEANLVSILQELDRHKAYLHFDCNSLMDYCLRRLKLSEAVASNLICVARKSIEVPELKKSIEAGEITVSKARKITPVLTKENQSTWLEIAKTKTSREIEKAVATEKPELLIPETAKYKSHDRIEFKVGISEELLKKLERIKDLEAQRTSENSNFESVLEAMAELYLKRNDPIEKARRAVQKVDLAKKEQTQVAVKQKAWVKLINPPIKTKGSASLNNHLHKSHVTGHVRTRQALPNVIKHAVVMRDLRRCTHQYSNGERCSSTRWLDVHHLTPVAKGGTNELHNLTTLCRAHHGRIHENMKHIN